MKQYHQYRVYRVTTSGFELLDTIEAESAGSALHGYMATESGAITLAQFRTHLEVVGRIQDRRYLVQDERGKKFFFMV
jgi:hypothetical protein